MANKSFHKVRIQVSNVPDTDITFLNNSHKLAIWGETARIISTPSLGKFGNNFSRTGVVNPGVTPYA